VSARSYNKFIIIIIIKFENKHSAQQSEKLTFFMTVSDENEYMAKS